MMNTVLSLSVLSNAYAFRPPREREALMGPTTCEFSAMCALVMRNRSKRPSDCLWYTSSLSEIYWQWLTNCSRMSRLSPQSDSNSLPSTISAFSGHLGHIATTSFCSVRLWQCVWRIYHPYPLSSSFFGRIKELWSKLTIACDMVVPNLISIPSGVAVILFCKHCDFHVLQHVERALAVLHSPWGRLDLAILHFTWMWGGNVDNSRAACRGW